MSKSLINKIKMLLLPVLVVTVSGCPSNAPILDMPEGGTAYNVEEYKIGVGDELSINVWRNAELSVSVPVRPDGKISTPLVGDVLAAGSTPEALAKNLTTSLSEYIRSPKVTVVVENPASSDFQQRVRVTGAVERPASVPFRKGMTVLDLVLSAGGTTEFAVANKARLYRNTADGTKVYVVKLNDILYKGSLETNYPLLPSDIVTVPERGF